MRELKATYRVPDGPQGNNGKENGTRPINDWEAALAYCGCTGNARQFAIWHASGYKASALRKLGMKSENIKASMERKQWMDNQGRRRAELYWKLNGR